MVEDMSIVRQPNRSALWQPRLTTAARIFTLPATTTTFEDSGSLTVVNFVTGILPGPATATDEVAIDAQVVTFNVRAIDPTLSQFSHPL